MCGCDCSVGMYLLCIYTELCVCIVELCTRFGDFVAIDSVSFCVVCVHKQCVCIRLLCVYAYIATVCVLEPIGVRVNLFL